MPAHTIDYIAAYATAGTALGTIGLSIATFVLALKTRALAQSSKETADVAEKELQLLREQTEAARRQSTAAEGALNASVRPLLLDIPLHTMRQLPKDLVERLGYRGPAGGPPPTEIDLSIISGALCRIGAPDGPDP